MKIIISCVLLGLSFVSLFLSVRSFQEKGILLNNAFLYANDEQKKQLNKTPYYRQSAFVFLMVGLLFLLNGLSVLMEMEWRSYSAMAMMPIVLVYVVVSNIRIERKK